MAGILIDIISPEPREVNRAIREFRTRWPGHEPRQIQVHKQTATPPLRAAVKEAGLSLRASWKRPGQIRVVGE